MADHKLSLPCIDRHQRGRGIEASLSRPRFFITYRNCCHLPVFVTETWRIGYRQASPVHPAAATDGCGAEAPCVWSTCTHAKPTLIVPGHPYRTDLHQKEAACVHSLIPGQDTSQHITTHIYQSISFNCALELRIRLLSTTSTTSTTF